MITYEMLPYLTENKTVPEIQLMYEEVDDKRIIFRESCKNFIDNFVPDWASEDKPFECDYFTEMTNFAGEVIMSYNITAIFRDENKNLVFDTDGDDVHVDFFRDEELLQLVEQISKS